MNGMYVCERKEEWKKGKMLDESTEKSAAAF